VSYSQPLGNEEIIEELNQTIKQLRNQLSELEVKVKLVRSISYFRKGTITFLRAKERLMS